MRMFIKPLAVYLHREPIDIRARIDAPAIRVEQEMTLSPLTGARLPSRTAGATA